MDSFRFNGEADSRMIVVCILLGLVIAASFLVQTVFRPDHGDKSPAHPSTSTKAASAAIFFT